MFSRQRGETGETRQRELATGADSAVVRFLNAGATGKDKFITAAGRTTKPE